MSTPSSKDRKPATSKNSRRTSAEEARDVAAESQRGSLLDALLKRAGRVAGGTLDLAADVATMSAMFGDSWLRDLISSGASPERLEAMAEAGHLLRDARETAGLSLHELALRLDLKDDEVLEDVERGEAILPLELMLRATSLLARHDPVPFLLRFLRTYNPQLEAALEQWGVMVLPKNFERERRFLNLYRQHDFLRELSDEEHQRFIEYMDASTNLVVEVMQREAAAPRRRTTRRTSRGQTSTKGGSATDGASLRRAGSRSGASAAAKRSRTTRSATAGSQRKSSQRRPVVRKVKPRAQGR